MSNINQNPMGADQEKECNPSVFSQQDTLFGSDTTSLHPLLGNRDGNSAPAASSPSPAPASTPLRGTEPQPNPSDDFCVVSTRVVKEIPRSYAKKEPPPDPASAMARLRRLLKPPVVKAFEALPSHQEGKTYHVDEEGRVIETTVRRAGVRAGVWDTGKSGAGGRS